MLTAQMIPLTHIDPSGLGFLSWLKGVFKRIVHATIHAVITAVFTFIQTLIMTGGNLHAALVAGAAAGVADFLKQIGWPSKGYWITPGGTPQWNPNAVAILGGDPSGLSRYIIYNLLGAHGIAAGSFAACVGGLQSTGFTKEAADLINQINGYEGTSRELLAVTWMNESGFVSHPDPFLNDHPEDINEWDVGPFQLSIKWTLRGAKKKELSFGGLNEKNVFGYNFYHSDGKTPAQFSGDPLSNGRMGARHLNSPGGSDLNKAMKYTKASSRSARQASFQKFAGAFRNFFNCYHP
jgi:hypothetical protein